jgi:hypothetical protein
MPKVYLHKFGEIINNFMSPNSFNDNISTSQNPECDVRSVYVVWAYLQKFLSKASLVPAKIINMNINLLTDGT